MCAACACAWACALHMHCMCTACALLLQAKSRAKELAATAGLQLVEEEEEEAGGREPLLPYTFMGYNMQSIARSARGRGSRHFPAHLTKNAGLDMMIIDQMRPLLDGGVRSTRFAAMLLELHTKEHDRAAIAHEEELAERRETTDPNCEGSLLSAYADKNRWAGLVPGERYLAAVYKSYSADIAPFLDAEVV